MPFESLDDCVIVKPKARTPRHRQASRKAAAVRGAVRRRFPDDERYLKLFRKVRRGGLVAAFHGRRVVGILLVQRKGRDAFRVSAKRFIRFYGPAKGLYLFATYRVSQLFPSAGDNYIASIWVAPAYRDAGVGARLVERALRKGEGRWSVNARPGGSERFFAQAGFAPRTGALARLVRLVTGCTPMERFVAPSGAAPAAHQIDAEAFAPDQPEAVHIR